MSLFQGLANQIIQNLRGGGGNTSNNSSTSASSTVSTSSTNNPSTNTRPTPGRGNYGTSASTSSTSTTTNRNNSAGAQALNQQISSNSSTNTTPTTPIITGKLDETPTGAESTILTGEDAGKTFTSENITPIKPSSPSTPVTPTDNSGNTDNTNNILNTPLAETIISAVTGEDKKPNNTNPAVRPAQRYAQSVVNPPQTQQNVYNPAAFAVGSAVSEAPKHRYLEAIRDDDIAVGTLSNSEYGVPSGIYRFDNKQEAEKFMKTLHDYDYDFGDEETRFYDEKGNFVGFLGSEAFPYAIVIPENRDTEIQSFWNTGGSKGGSPAKGTSWSDTPSPKMTSQLKDDFDFIYTSRNTSNSEIRDLLGMKDIDTSQYRPAEISYTFRTAAENQQPAEKTTTAKRDPYADGTFSIPTQDDTILNNPFEIIGTLIGVGALSKFAGIGGKIGGSAADTWVSTGGKTMSGSTILSHSSRPIIGGSRGRKAGEYVTKTADSSQYKLAELGIGATIGGVYAGKEIQESGFDFSEIIPQNRPQEVEATGSLFTPEIIPEYSIKSELSVNQDISGSEIDIEQGKKHNVPETGIGDNKYIFNDGNKTNHGQKHENEFSEWERWAEKTRNLERNRTSQANRNDFRNRNSNSNVNRLAYSSPYLFEFADETRDEERRRRKRDDERRKRTGSGQIDFYRVVTPVGDFGLFREKPEKSRKIATEKYSFVEIDGYRKTTNRSRKAKKQPKQDFGIRAINPFGGRR